MKHPQHIIAFDKERFGLLKNGFNFMNLQDMLAAAQRSLILGRRAELETDERYGQMLPYIVLYGDAEDGGVQFFAYQRGKGIGEDRLLGNWSVGLGGHVDFGDVQQKNSVIDVLGTINNAMVRELEEEVLFSDSQGAEIKPNLKPVFFGVINDLRDPVGAVHYGLLYGIKLPAGVAVSCREVELEAKGFYSAKQLAMDEKNGHLKLEGWTQLALAEYREFEELAKII